MLRHVDGPSKVYVTSGEAAKWLGLERRQFEALARAEDWLRPVYFGRNKRWHWMDLVVFGHLYHQRVKTDSNQKNSSAGGE